MSLTEMGKTMEGQFGGCEGDSVMEMLCLQRPLDIHLERSTRMLNIVFGYQAEKFNLERENAGVVSYMALRAVKLMRSTSR